ncbi:MAG: PKD domain-containing protein, partial [Actinomycetota bacterium]
LRNLGGADADDVAVSVELPPEVEFVDASDRGAHGAGTVTFPIVDLPRGATATRTITVRVPLGLAPGSVELLATASAAPASGLADDRNPDDNEATDSTTASATNATPVVDAGVDATVTVGEVYSLDPATYSDTDAGDTHTSIIDWGDGSSEPGNLAGSAGSGIVGGGHVFGAPGPRTVEVCVTDQFGAIGCDDLTVSVLPGIGPVPNERPTVDAGPDVVAVLDEPIALPPATFVDPNVADTHTATVDWGDGAGPQPATIDQDLDTISSAATYSAIQITTVTVCATDDSGDANDTGCDSFFVKVEPPAPPNNPPLVDAGPGAGIQAGDPFVLAPATFTDPDVGDTHEATVDWGDGSSPEVGRVGADATVAGEVRATHVFVAPGAYTTEVCVIDSGGLTDCDTTLVSVGDGAVPNAPPLVDAGPDQIVEAGTPVALAPASFVDENSNDTHTATVDWGAGAGPAPATVDEADGDGTVSAGTTFASAGVYTVAVCVTDDSGLANDEGCDSLEVVVTDEPAPNEPPVVAIDIAGQVRVGEQTGLMAPFTDANPSDAHTAEIDWGDAAIEPGALDQGAGQGTVTGSHTWTTPGTFTVEVCVTDDADEANSTGCATANVAVVENVAPAVEIGDDRTVDEGSAVELTALIIDGDDVDGHTATVDWDDGAGPQPVAVTAGEVRAGYTYDDDGTHDVEVCVTDPLGAVGCDQLVVIVLNVAPTPTIEGPATATAAVELTLVGSFQDPGTGDTHTATIDWGDGNSSATLRTVLLVDGRIDGAHTYDEPGEYTITVTVTDDDGGTGQTTQRVDVTDTPPSTTMPPTDVPPPDPSPEVTAQAEPTSELPATGQDPRSWVLAGLALALLGLGFVMASRRSRARASAVAYRSGHGVDRQTQR